MRWTRLALPALLAALPVSMLATPLSAQEGDADRAVEGGGTLAEGWMGRTDRGQNFDNVRFTETDGTLDISVGPALILYRPGDTAEGTYTVTGTFEQVSTKGHAHGAGLIIGGADLQGPGQVYTYFLVRGDGAYLVKTRTGDETAYLTQWTPSGAIHKEGADGHATNTMSIEVGATDTVFKLNGTEVHREKTADIYTDGIWGVRLNHNLDMRIGSLAVDGAM